MRAVVQRVSQASVTVGEEVVGRIGQGLVVLIGVTHEDGEKEARWLARKIAGLRIFEDDAGKMNLSVRDVGGEVLVVSQFTLYGDARKGRRPSFVHAAPPDHAEPLIEAFCRFLEEEGVPVQTGRFRAMMEVCLCNSGPVTIILDTP
ncbi:MAG: D-tyrosyl-tRNA(Tyr) deacylase [Chloroflexi bacterium]|nr:D-tyrosyl-tRNA(Tyr) deacylase [Chloroflexota bacterium]